MSTSVTPMLPAGFTPQGFLPSPGHSLKPPGRTIGRTRRRHAAIAVVSAFMALLFVTLIAFHGYVAWIVAHPYVAPLTSNPKIAKGLDYTDAVFPSKSGRTTVHGWYIAADAAALLPAKTIAAAAGGDDQAAAAPVASDRTVVFSHGYGANREETWVPMYDLAALLHRLHYNVLMFDYGYASEADRSPATGGVEEAQQLLAAVQYARSQGAEQVVVWGFSMGAGTALQAALQTDASDDIDALILDSLFLPSPESLFNNVRQYLDLPRFPSLPLVQLMLPFWTGTSFNQIPAQQVMQTSYTIPTFIMHGTDDVKAPIATAEHIASSQLNPLSREWVVQGGKHELLFQTRPKEYIQRAALFLSQVDADWKSNQPTLTASAT